MRTRAAAATATGKLLEIMDVPLTNEVLVEINKEFDQMHAGESIRSVVVFY